MNYISCHCTLFRWALQIPNGSIKKYKFTLAGYIFLSYNKQYTIVFQFVPPDSWTQISWFCACMCTCISANKWSPHSGFSPCATMLNPSEYNSIWQCWIVLRIIKTTPWYKATTTSNWKVEIPWIRIKNIPSTC